MLTVTENGIKIQLQTHPQPTHFLKLMVATALLLSAVGVGLALGFLSVRLSIAAIGVIAIFSWVWRFYQQKYDVPVITGGELFISNQQILHQKSQKNQKIVIQDSDRLQILPNQQFAIINQQGKTRYLILGFHDIRQLEIMQAVLQGKTIQTQEKTIQFQPTMPQND